MNAKLFLRTIALAAVFAGCASSNGETPPYVMPYATPEELAKRQSPVPLLPPDSSGNIVFNLQYPSGTKDGGMITSALDKNSDFKNKYFSKYTDKNNTDWIRISLDASDQGKSQNGSSVRVELAQKTNWAFKDTHSFTYTFLETAPMSQKQNLRSDSFWQENSQTQPEVQQTVRSAESK